jgi:hypothetical protein
MEIKNLPKKFKVMKEIKTRFYITKDIGNLKFKFQYFFENQHSPKFHQSISVVKKLMYSKL